MTKLWSRAISGVAAVIALAVTALAGPALATMLIGAHLVSA